MKIDKWVAFTVWFSKFSIFSVNPLPFKSLFLFLMRSLDLAFDEKPFKTSQIVHNFTFKFFCHSTQLKRPFMTQASKQIMHRHRKKRPKDGQKWSSDYWALLTADYCLCYIEWRKSVNPLRYVKNCFIKTGTLVQLSNFVQLGNTTWPSRLC